MDQDICNPRQLRLQGRPYMSTNRVGGGDRQRRIDLDVQVDVILQACLSCKYFVDPLDPCDGSRDRHNVGRKFRRGHRVDELERCVP